MNLRLKQDRRGVSNIIVVVLSLVIVVAIIANIVLWGYEMNQLDWEKMKEDIIITNVERGTEINGTRFTFKNEGALTSHLVSLWIINSTNHQRYDINVFVNSAETTTYLRADISLPDDQYTVKVVTERGNIAVCSG
ncbi:MAG: hypothetical protein OEY47_08795 [Candidatus Bathyarchaeota archaeon]|nr:hypothetical protein [Candidatus Bathyarchaeota archaeon]